MLNHLYKYYIDHLNCHNRTVTSNHRIIVIFIEDDLRSSNRFDELLKIRDVFLCSFLFLLNILSWVFWKCLGKFFTTSIIPDVKSDLFIYTSILLILWNLLKNVWKRRCIEHLLIYKKVFFKVYFKKGFCVIIQNILNCYQIQSISMGSVFRFHQYVIDVLAIIVWFRVNVINLFLLLCQLWDKLVSNLHVSTSNLYLVNQYCFYLSVHCVY